MTSINPKIFITAIITSTLLIPNTSSVSSAQTTSDSPAIAAASTATTKQVHYKFNFPNGTLSGPAVIKKGVTYVDIRGIAENAGLTMEWDTSGNRALFSGWTKSFAIRIGSRNGLLDGTTVDLGGIPFKSKEDGIYVPVRFLVKAFEGGNLTLDKQTNTLTADGFKTYNTYTNSFGGQTYTLVKATGDLYVSQGKDKVLLLASLGKDLNLDWVGLDINKTPGGLLVIKIMNSYGEPHINTRETTLVFKNGALLRKATFGYQFRGDGDIKSYDNNLLLHDGNTLRVIQDGTGSVIATLDLLKLGGGDEDTYYLEGVDKDIILLRGNRKGLLTLIDLPTGERTLLYKDLLSPEDQEYAELNDVTFKGDSLKYEKRIGNQLYFINDSPLTGKTEVIYTMK